MPDPSRPLERAKARGNALPAADARLPAASERGRGDRGSVADGALSLRWARVGAIPLAAPLAIAIVAINSLPESGQRAFGWPFWALAAATAIVLIGAAVVAGRLPASRAGGPARAGLGMTSPRPLERLLAMEAVALWIAYDLAFLANQRLLYDFDVYTGSALRWLHGGQPYLTSAIGRWPETAAQDYFLYPPPLLPFFAVLAQLPGPLAVGLWLALLVGAGYAAFRLLGLSRLASMAFLAFPPMVVGISSGNVASLLFLCFAAGFRNAAALVPATLFKVQAALPALWPIRERRWSELGKGLAFTAAIVLATLPITGFGSWRDWAASLGYRAQSQVAIPSLFGSSPAQFLPAPVYAAVAVALVAVALWLPGRRGLAALGLAAIWASPSLWPHGFLFALPAVLVLEDGAARWLVLGAGAGGPRLWYLFYAGWAAVLAAREPAATAVASRPSGSRLPWRRGWRWRARQDEPYASRAPFPATRREPGP